MPLFDFIAADGAIIERLTPHNQTSVVEGGKKYVRATVSRIRIGGVVKPSNQKQEVLAGYYNCECQQGSRFRSKYSKETIKQAWEHDN
jgi:hypothetical protein